MLTITRVTFLEGCGDEKGFDDFVVECKEIAPASFEKPSDNK